jgi:serine/threonine protein phosphatase PrpC
MMSNKVCQDNCFVIEKGGRVFAGLFDGHGTSGHKISEFCVLYLQNYYSENFARFAEDPKAVLRECLLKTNDELRFDMEADG